MRHALRSLSLLAVLAIGCAGTKAAAPAAVAPPAAGVSAATAKVTIPVEGMSCGCCVRRVTEALEAVTGVTSAEVLLAEKRAIVSYDPARVQPAALAAAIRDAGYEPGAPVGSAP